MISTRKEPRSLEYTSLKTHGGSVIIVDANRVTLQFASSEPAQRLCNLYHLLSKSTIFDIKLKMFSLESTVCALSQFLRVVYFPSYYSINVFDICASTSCVWKKESALKKIARCSLQPWERFLLEIIFMPLNNQITVNTGIFSYYLYWTVLQSK